MLNMAALHEVGFSLQLTRPDRTPIYLRRISRGKGIDLIDIYKFKGLLTRWDRGYFHIFNDFSKYMYVDLLKNKSDAFYKFTNFNKEDETQVNRKSRD